MPRCNGYVVAGPDVEPLNAIPGAGSAPMHKREPLLERRAKVLCAIDTRFRSRSGAAVERAHAIARGVGAQLLLAHVVDGATSARAARSSKVRARFILDSYARKLARRGQETQISLRAGRPHETIADVAIEWDADLIVLGPYRERFGDSFLGTTAERVAGKAERPVLVVNRQSTGIYQQVLLASDLSSMSAGIARVAKQLGLLEGSRTAVVHALEHSRRAMLYLAGVSESEARKYQRTRSQIASNEVAMQLGRADLSPVDFSFFFPKASPLPAIEQVAQLVGSDLVVVGSSRFPELKRWFVGSVSNDVLRWLENDVLLVSPAAARRARKQASSRLRQSMGGRSAAIEPASIGRNR